MDSNTNSCNILDVAVNMLAQRFPIVCSWQKVTDCQFDRQRSILKYTFISFNGS